MPETKRKVFALLLEALLALRRENKEVLWASMIKDTMKRKKPSFNEEYYGYRTFSDLLEDAQQEGLLELEKHKTSRTYVVTRFGLEMKPGVGTWCRCRERDRSAQAGRAAEAARDTAAAGRTPWPARQPAAAAASPASASRADRHRPLPERSRPRRRDRPLGRGAGRRHRRSGRRGRGRRATARDKPDAKPASSCRGRSQPQAAGPRHSRPPEAGGARRGAAEPAQKPAAPESRAARDANPNRSRPRRPSRLRNRQCPKPLPPAARPTTTTSARESANSRPDLQRQQRRAGRRA